MAWHTHVLLPEPRLLIAEILSAVYMVRFVCHRYLYEGERMLPQLRAEDAASILPALGFLMLKVRVV